MKPLYFNDATEEASYSSFITALILTLSIVSNAPSQSIKNLASVTPSPIIVCEEPSFDFGTVTNTPLISHVFSIRNAGDAELIIKKVKPACGCTTTALATNAIPPGAEIHLKTTLSLKGRKGHQTKTIDVSSNDPESPNYRLTLKGIVHTEVLVYPKQFRFQVTPETTNLNQELVITFKTDKPAHVTEIETNKASFCKFELQETIKGKEYRVKAKLLSDFFRTSNSLRGEIFMHTDFSGNQLIQIPVSATYLQDVVVAPQQFFLVISTNYPVPISRPIMIKNRTKTPLDIVSIDIPPAVSVTTQMLSTTVHRLNFRFKSPSTSLVGQEIKIHIKRKPDSEYHFTLPLHVTFLPE